MTNEISSVTIPVHYSITGSVTQKRSVSFRIFQEDDWFKAIPLLPAGDKLPGGWPEELIFVCVNHTVVAANHMQEETLMVINQIVAELEVQALL